MAESYTIDSGDIEIILKCCCAICGRRLYYGENTHRVFEPYLFDFCFCNEK
jgi:hypothetical protein